MVLLSYNLSFFSLNMGFFFSFSGTPNLSQHKPEHLSECRFPTTRVLREVDIPQTQPPLNFFLLYSNSRTIWIPRKIFVSIFVMTLCMPISQTQLLIGTYFRSILIVSLVQWIVRCKRPAIFPSGFLVVNVGGGRKFEFLYSPSLRGINLSYWQIWSGWYRLLKINILTSSFPQKRIYN